MTNEADKLAELFIEPCCSILCLKCKGIKCPHIQGDYAYGLANRLAKKAFDAGYRQVEPVHLEALGDDEFREWLVTHPCNTTSELAFIGMDNLRVQATIEANEKRLGQLYRVKE